MSLHSADTARMSNVFSTGGLARETNNYLSKYSLYNYNSLDYQRVGYAPM